MLRPPLVGQLVLTSASHSVSGGLGPALAHFFFSFYEERIFLILILQKKERLREWKACPGDTQQEEVDTGRGMGGQGQRGCA